MEKFKIGEIIIPVHTDMTHPVKLI